MYMKIIKYIICVFLVLGCSNESSLKLNGNLQPLYTFANGTDDYLVNPIGFVSNGEDLIYVSDNIPSQIKKYSKDGELLEIFGRRGKGPGEFNYPGGLAYFDNSIFVEDRGNLRFKILTENGETNEIYKILNPFVDFTVNENLVYTFSPPSFFLTKNLQERDLITVYNRNGNISNSFGDFITYSEKIPAGMSWPFLQFSNHRLHSVFQYFPLYRIYTAEGELVKEFDLSTYVQKDVLKNFDEETYLDPTSPSMEVVFRAFYVSDNGVYIAHQSENIQIDKFILREDELEYQNTYYYSTNENMTVVEDFFYHQESDTFFILEYNGQAHQITRYEIVQSK